MNIDEPGYLYRRHQNSDLVTNCPPEIHVPEHLRLVNEFDWWNPLNCLVAFFSGGPEGRSLVKAHWRQACKLNRVASSLEASGVVVYKRVLRFFIERKMIPA